MRRLGILGGMGPLATIDLFTKIVELTPAGRDQDHIPIIIDNYPQIEDRTGYILNGGVNPLPRLIEAAKRLEASGVEVILMPCNTAHYFAEDILSVISIPLIHIVDSAISAIKNDYPKARRAGVIATTGTKAAKVYEGKLNVAGFEVINLGDVLEKDIMSCIYDGVKAGKTQDYVELFQSCIDRVTALGADVIIAACTEIPLIMPYVKTNTPVIDATLELAKSAVKFAKG